MNYRVIAKGLNVRSGPGVSYAKVGPPLAYGAEVEALSSAPVAGWLHIRYGQGGAWVAGWYLESIGDLKNPTGQQIVDKAMEAKKKPYIFGYEVKLDDPDPEAFDCSELVQWVCAQLGVTPEMPDGARYQLAHCRQHGLEIKMRDALTTPGALLFMGDPAHHVAISQGNGKTIEARGKYWGCGCWAANRPGFTSACLIPGVDYGNRKTYEPA